MENFKMTRNASGYYDETAYKSIMGVAKPGEIWECSNGNGTSEYLIIKNHERTCSALKLTESGNDKSLCVLGGYVDVRMLQYIYNHTLSRRTDTLPEEEFAEVCNEIAFALDIKTSGEPVKIEQTVSEAIEPEISYADMLSEMLMMFGAQAFAVYCRCALFESRFRGDSKRAEIFRTGLEKAKEMGWNG